MPHATPADHAACAAAIKVGSRSFHAAGRFLPADLRRGAFALYAFCRLSDDAIDQGGERLEALLARLDRVFAGAPAAHPAERALADTVARFALPRAPFDALLEGFAWDLAGRRYASLGAVRAYAARVAGSVGAMMAALMGARSPALLARACDLGVAMQLTNIARDVAEDAINGRLYLPTQRLAAHGLDADAWLARPAPHPAIVAVCGEVLSEAQRLYARADSGVEGLPARVRPAIRAARLLYCEIGQELARRGGDPMAGRAIVASARKAALIAGALAPLPVAAGALAARPLTETAFLVEACARPQAQAPRGAEFVLDLLARLAARDAPVRSATVLRRQPA